jgi:hypothetical protein
MIRRVVASVVVACALGPVASGQVKLEYKVAEGTTERHKMESKVHQLLTIEGMEILTDVDQSAVTTSVNGKRNADGTLPIEVTLDSFKIRMGLPGGIELNLDSTDKDLKVDVPQLAFLSEMLKAMRGASYTVVLDSKDKVKFVEGTEKNLAKAGELTKQAADTLKARFDPDRIKREFEQMYGNLPDGLVREGEPWERTETSDVGGGQTLTFKRQYEYKGTVKQDGKNLDKIAVKAIEVTYKMDPNAGSPAKVTRSDLKIESSEGSILFDRAAGAAVDRRDKTRITGGMGLNIMNKDYDAKLDLTFESHTTVAKDGK